MSPDLLIATAGIVVSLIIGLQVRRTRQMWKNARELPPEVDQKADEVSVESNHVRSKIREYRDKHDDPLSALVASIHGKRDRRKVEDTR